jgi:RNA methyltransferase, TrmH family
VITSPHNKRVAGAVRLKKRALREKDGRFLVEGAQGVAEALRSTAVVHEVFVSPEPPERQAVVRDLARGRGVAVHDVAPEVMAHLTSTVTPQGVVAVAGFVDVSMDALLAAPGPVAILVEARDPGNAGTILRSADAAGAGGVVFTTSSVDPYNPKAVRATAGSLFHVPVVRLADARAAIGACRAAGRRVLGADAGGATSVFEADLTGPVALVFGNEAHGLPAEALAEIDDTIRVPISGRAESLNLAAAAAVILFECARQRGPAAELGDLDSPPALPFGSTPS